MNEIIVPLKPIIGFAIYNPDTQKWSRGGYRPKWSNTPKIWTRIGDLKSHLQNQIYDHYPRSGDNEYKIIINSTYKNCIIVDISTNLPSKQIDLYLYLEEVAHKHVQTLLLRGSEVKLVNKLINQTINYKIEKSGFL